jgi:hypothetical protein
VSARSSAPGTFRSFNYPGRFIRHRDFALWVERSDGSPQFTKDATFFVVPPKSAPIRLAEPVGVPAHD